MVAIKYKKNRETKGDHRLWYQNCSNIYKYYVDIKVNYVVAEGSKLHMYGIQHGSSDFVRQILLKLI